MMKNLLAFCLLITQSFAALGISNGNPNDTVVVASNFIGHDSLSAPIAAPCDFTVLNCGETLNNQTNSGGINDFNVNFYCNYGTSSTYAAEDRQYKVTITETTSVRFVLNINTPNQDLDMFLLSNCSGSISCLGGSAEKNVTNNIYREVLDVSLTPGVYYLIVDGRITNNVANYSISASCACTCVEASSDMPTGDKIYCDNFENYVAAPNNLDPQSTRWRKWRDTSNDAVVELENGNKVSHFQQIGTSKPDLIYQLGNKTSGRYRVSWRMKVPTGKKGYFNIQHELPNILTGNGGNWAFEVFFFGNGTGQFKLQNSAGGVITRDFGYPNDTWFNVVGIFDLGLVFTNDPGSGNLFINDNSVYAWDFASGSVATQNKLAGLNFYADDQHDFYIDDLCVWSRLVGSCPATNFQTVCLKNGGTISGPDFARCALYTSREWWPCYNACDYGGTFVYRGDNISGLLEPTDLGFDLPLNNGNQNCEGNPIIVGDVYVFYRDNNDPINVSYSSSDSLSQYFVFTCNPRQFNGECNFIKNCLGSNNDDINNLTNLPCNRFYYIVVIGPVGTTYNFSLFPTGPCAVNPQQLTCGSTATNIATSTGSTLSVASGAYTQCYSGTRTYNGGEKVYQFTLEKPTQVNISLTSNAQMGLFLYGFLCGKNCIDYAENSAAATTTSLSTTLSEGTYYIVADKATAGSATFSLQLQCTPFSTFFNPTISNVSACPLDQVDKHTVRINGSSFPLSTKDQIQFLFRDSTNNFALKGTDSLVLNWNGSAFMDFNIKKDVPNDGEKCSFAIGDTFTIYLLQRDRGKRIIRKLLPTYESGLSSANIFSPGGQSTIINFKPDSVYTFGTQTLELNPPPTASTNTLTFSTNLPWTASIVQNTPNWLTLDKLESDGAEDIKVQSLAHTGLVPRTATIRFVSKQYPDVFQQFVKVQQQGICNNNPDLSVSNSIPTVCAGTSTTLAAQVLAGTESLYTYAWSNGSTSQSIFVTPNSTTTYTVTISNVYKYCPVLKSANATVTVNPRPAPPTNPVNQTVCKGQTIPALSVSVLAGQTVDWYDAPSNGTNVKSNANTFTPAVNNPGTYTYYAQSKLVSTGCVSISRLPVTLTILPLPTLSVVSPPTCAPDLTYSVTVMTNGTDIITSSGNHTNIGSNFIITGIDKNVNVTVTALGANNCNDQITINRPSDGCPCPTIAAPVSNGNKTICSDDPIPALSVMAVSGQSVDWYNSNDVLIASGTFTLNNPPGAGTYYAEAHDLISGCIGDTRTAISLTINSLPTITVVDKFCNPAFTSYTVTGTLNAGLTLTSSAGQPSVLNGVFTIINIPTGINVNLTVNNPSTNCDFTTEVSAPVCMCMGGINPPVSLGNKKVCLGQNIPPLEVSVNANETVDWYNASGTLIKSNSTSFNAITPGTYFAETRNTINNCKSDSRTAVKLIINPLPTLSVVGQQCTPDLKFYSLTITSNATNLTANAGTVNPIQNGFTVSNIPKSVNCTLTAIIDSTGCVSTQLVDGLPCPCPTVNTPISGGNKAICQGQNFPLLSVIVGQNETADWFDPNNFLVGSGLNFQPSSAGTYSAETRNLIHGCSSLSRTPVTLSINPLPFITMVEKSCTPDLLSFKISLSTAINASLSASHGNITGGNGVFLVSGITPEQNVVLTTTDTITGCSFQLPENGIKCDCPVINPPGSSGDQAICEGADFPVLTVTVNANETVNWYNAFGVLVASNTKSYQPTQAGIYYAEAQNSVSKCTSTSKTPIALTVNPKPVVIIQDTICAENRLSYDAILFTDGIITNVNPNYSVINNGNSFTIDDIPIGTTVTVTSRFQSTNCKTELAIKKVACPCPQLPPPVSNGDKVICETDLIPELTVSVGPNETADWYTEPTGGSPLNLGTSTTKFKPTFDGTFFVQRRNLESSCISSSRIPVRLTINELPIVNTDGTQTSICEGDLIQLKGSISGGIGGQWISSLPGGNFIPSNLLGEAVEYAPPAGTTFVALTLVSNDPVGPCPAVSAQTAVTINPKPFIQIDTVFCDANLQNLTVRFKSNGKITQSIGTLTQQNALSYTISNVPNAVGVNITAVSNDSCQNTISIAANSCNCPFVEPAVSNGDQFVCPGVSLKQLSVKEKNGFSANWYNTETGGVALSVKNTKFTPTAAGPYYAEAINLSNDCVASVRTLVTHGYFEQPMANAGIDRVSCALAPLELTAQNIQVTYNWSNGQNTQSIVVTPNASTAYVLTVTNAEGCNDTDTLLVSILPNPAATITETSQIKCFGNANGALKVTATGGSGPYNLVWSNGALTPQNNGLSSGNYQVTITDNLGCVDTTSFLLEQPALLEILNAEITNTIPGLMNGSIDLFVSGSTGKYQFKWTQDGFIIPNSDTLKLTGLEIGQYAVTVTDQNGCTVSGGPYQISTVGVLDASSIQQYVTLFPNPTTGLLQLRFNLPELSEGNVQIYNALGSEVLNQRYTSLLNQTISISLQHLAAGAYFINLNVNYGRANWKIKLVKD